VVNVLSFIDEGSAMSKDLLREILSDLEVLKHRVDVQERFISVLMVMIPKERRDELAKLTRAYQLNAIALHEDGKQTADGMAHFKNCVDALGDTPDFAALVLLSQASLVSDAPEGQREAMKTYLSFATDDEVAHDLLQSLNLSPKNMPPSGADSADDAKDDKD